MMKSSFYCALLSTLVLPSLGTAAAGAASKVVAKTEESYNAGATAGEKPINGITGMTYNEDLKQYVAMADTGILPFTMAVATDNTVTVTAGDGLGFPVLEEVKNFITDNKELEHFEYVKATESADTNQYYLIATTQDMVFYQSTGTGTVSESLKASFKLLADGTSKIGGIATLQGADTQYVVYSSQAGLAADKGAAESGCDKDQCLRLSVNKIEVSAEGKPTITELYQLRYDLALQTDGTTANSLRDIALFETADNKVLYAVTLESDRKLYFVKLSGDGAEKDGAKDVGSKCSTSLTADDTCKAIKSIEKTELYQITEELQFQTLDVIYRDDAKTLLDSNKKLMLLVTNNNAADSLTILTKFAFLELDTTDLLTTTTTTTTSEDSKNSAHGSYHRSAAFVAYSCVLAAFYKFIAN